ncbi:16S rRNA (guanine(966)-N(2))-methyltransferase [Lentibacillus sp. JNUCC-1]|uniref:16S rRNA (guanine(966)-N(2))-methyltransferase RsmD n=1 Tax=Lentibacillus sp. JNUCC-1 TaxID=2654513 RepID=UPI0012E91C8E|nr:16S rRNA (guanine(966)-N(2))-methyltransferase RsmD [Lentibacillus sp. JNUCC-1]MUV36241.1 16S rRNA (guanine(966)-N(2))-methyltransferase [Lentibacillus sp. JNUCC-1]
MRIISGDLKGHPLKAVPGKMTRPTSDKIKEAAFQMMGPYFNGGACLDLFAGSGALGCEALSRGMDTCIFIDQSKPAVHTIQTNINALRLSQRAEILKTNALRAIDKMGRGKQRFDLIFIDPPYKKVNYTAVIEALIKQQLINDEAIIYCEHDPDEELPQENMNLTLIKRAQYGKTTAITLYQFLDKGAQDHE